MLASGEEYVSAAFVENGVLVSEGLQVGDTVVSKGYQKMYNGARVSF